MLRKTLSGIIQALLILILLMLTLNIRVGKAEQVAIIVPADYVTIQEAINQASEECIIYVKAGTYHEDITINKRGLRIFGDDKESIIQGRVVIASDNVLLSGFTIKGNGQSATGVFLDKVDHCSILNNNVSNMNTAISINHEPGMLEGVYGRNNVCRNVLTNNSIGILSRSSMGIPPQNIYGDNMFGNILINNSFGFLLSYDIGIPIVDKTYDDNIIRGNTLLNNVHAFYFNYSIGNLALSNNEVVFGGNIICENNITGNEYAIEVYCEEIGNLATYGNVVLVFGYNRVLNNSFINNGITSAGSIRYIGNWALDTLDGKFIAAGLEYWDDGYPSGGNYWSDYSGVDEKRGPNQDQPGSDGIGDASYTIDASNLDKYPLMNPRVPSDSTSPSTISTYDGLWYNTDFSIYLLATDELSGVKETYYRVNDGPIRNVSANGHPLITVEGSNITLEYWSIDNADNEESPHKMLAEIKLDKTPPADTIIINDNASYANSTSVTLTLSATDALSGVSQVRYSNDGVWDTETWELFLPTKSWVLTTGDGNKFVYVQFKDTAGCISQSYYGTIILDKTHPTISITSPSPGYQVRSSTLTITWTGSDETSGIGYCEIRLDGGSWVGMGTNVTYTFTGLGDGTHTVDVKAIDKAGNMNQEEISFVVNTSPLLGPGYIEEIAITAVLVITALGIVLYFLKIRKRKPRS